MTNGPPPKPNFFLLLGLDPDAPWDEARFERMLREKTVQWTKQSGGIATSTTTRTARQCLRLVREIEEVMGDPAARRAQAEAGRKDRAAAVARRRLELEERLDIVLRKGFVFDTERKAIEKDYPDQRDLLAGRPLGKRLEAAETRSETAGVARRQRLEPVAAQNIRAALEVLNLRTLYEALATVAPEVTDTSPLPVLRAAADELYRQAHRTMDKSPEVGARQQLAGFAKTIFAGEEGRRRYDTTVELQPLDQLIQQFDQALATVDRVEASQVEWLLDRARKRGIDPDEAMVEVADHFARRKTVELPRAAAEALRTQVQCWNCGGWNEPAAAPEPRCGLCQVQLRTSCPGCRTTVPGGAARCGTCGLRVWMRGPVAVTVEDLEEALGRRDLDSAGTLLAAARRDWNLPADSEDELAVRIRDAQAQLHELRRQEQRSAAELTATVVAMMGEHRYQSARSTLLVASSRLPDRERLMADTVLRIGEADILYQQAMRPGTGNQRRADLLAMALRVCADHDPARTALAEIPPPPPVDLRAVPSASGDIVHLTWRPPLADQVRFVVVRKSGNRPPVSPHDGTQVATVTEPGCDDRSPEPGVPLWYAVFSDRVGGPSASEAATLVDPVVVVPEVAELSLVADARSVTGSWSTHPRTQLVMVARRELRPPRTADDGDPVGPVTLVGFIDSGVRTGVTYHYRVSAVYATPEGQRYVSSGVVASATPALPATAVTDLEVTERLLDDGVAVDAVWTPPAGGSVSIHLSEVPPAWPRGATVAPAEVASLARPLPGMPEPLPDRRMRLAVPPVHGRRFLTAVTVGGAGAVIGNTVELDLLEPVGGLAGERLDEVVRLSWVWPADSTAARVRWWPAGLPSQPLGERRCLRYMYAEQGGFEARIGTRAVTVSVQALLDERTGGLGSAPALIDVPALATPVRYSIRRRALTGRGKATVVLSTSVACELPDLLVIQRPGAVMPLGPEDGEVVMRVPAQTLQPGSPLSVVVTLRPVRGPSWLACFPKAGSGVGVTLVPPPVNELKVS